MSAESVPTPSTDPEPAAGPEPTGSDFATCDLYDADESLQSLSLQLLNLGGRARFTGPIRTISCHRDNGLVKELLNSPGAGAVLVVDGAGSLDSALLGDMIAASAIENGWAGVVIHGAVRDREQLAEMDLGVRALGSNPRKSVKDGLGEVDVPVQFGGVTFVPGATLWSDADGVLVTPA
ncbi:ribonuclease E activity regulator RraA [Nesterenkonia sp. LB17]|uniref:ribonuclease E activity regulator RraA n=1 Tax=unclassified Nesterenkonia TaxID=2629769 RepID=UPI001F4CD82C|nr:MULTISPECIES: ribonuclease E activity regulator RraA [unclassified Nesterenkonia]MCH8559838.1 ribonuclease E activity regulator RraA [Nesterenkonia sp. DZ6]MCH8562002.1 ribonuclease E activity regulator RraA [Nesterenkonia sp. YGD6]MCH8564461.1 ribonuclease E activity regulator RraA [Nesterenkonia sp. LB17]